MQFSEKSFFIIIGLFSIFFLSYITYPINAINSPEPQVSASIYYPDTCYTEFSVEFEISNLGSPSSGDSYLVISLSSNLEYVN